ncbi:MAG: polyprenyl synthetase family protein [Ignavibacteriales bacterium]|nr:polyprenyl synthetase family protein [Ignavibacteriales bacterium]
MSLLSSSSLSLGDIKAPVEAELRDFEAHFRAAIKSNVGLVDVVTRYIIRQKGKRVRPLLVLLSAKTCGTVSEKTFRGATLVEILHTATLVHDDVVDDADTRRGFASINAVWKNKVAVLMGDFLLSRGLLLSLKHGDFPFLECTSNAVKRMSEGELLQIQKSRYLNLDEPTYLRIISDKTASLFSACTEIGAISGSENSDHRERLRSFGEHVGLAFQIRDDLLDYLGRSSIIGKPTGIDIKEKKLTLPLIHALRTGERADARKALRLVKNGASRKDVAWVLEFAERNGGIAYASTKAEEFGMLARKDLESFPGSPAKQSMLQFVEFVLTRDA